MKGLYVFYENTRFLFYKLTDTVHLASLPQNHMFREMRAALNIPKEVDILDHVNSLSDTCDEPPGGTIWVELQTSPRSRAIDVIRSIERRTMTKQEPQPGLVELMKYLTDRNIPKALCTRNFPAPVEHLLDNYLAKYKSTFEPIITRETRGVKPKPSPEGIWKIAQAWGLDRDSSSQTSLPNAGESAQNENDVLETARRYLGSGLIMVGDSVDDMASGYRAGAATVLLVNEDNDHLAEHEYTDLSIQRLDELIDILDRGFSGKR